MSATTAPCRRVHAMCAGAGLQRGRARARSARPRCGTSFRCTRRSRARCKTVTGIPCPFCGMTRAVVAGVHGDIVRSLAFNPGGLLVIALAIYVLIRARLPATAHPGVARLRRARRALGLEHRASTRRSTDSWQRSGVDFAAAFERAAERDLVGVLEVAADGQAARDARDPRRRAASAAGRGTSRWLRLRCWGWSRG